MMIADACKQGASFIKTVKLKKKQARKEGDEEEPMEI